MVQEIVQQLRSKNEKNFLLLKKHKNKNKKNWTLKVALRPSGVLLVGLLVCWFVGLCSDCGLGLKLGYVQEGRFHVASIRVGAVRVGAVWVYHFWESYWFFPGMLFCFREKLTEIGCFVDTGSGAVMHVPKPCVSNQKDVDS